MDRTRKAGSGLTQYLKLTQWLKIAHALPDGSYSKSGVGADAISKADAMAKNSTRFTRWIVLEKRGRG
nr:hypothetical protein HB_022 [Hyphantria cunea nucleopolyhedrovirus]